MNYNENYGVQSVWVDTIDNPKLPDPKWLVDLNGITVGKASTLLDAMEIQETIDGSYIRYWEPSECVN